LVFKQFCEANEAKIFNARSDLISDILAGKPCIDSYNELYAGTPAEVFDPLSLEQDPEVVCT